MQLQNLWEVVKIAEVLHQNNLAQEYTIIYGKNDAYAYVKYIAYIYICA